MERIAIIDGIRTPFSKMGANFNYLSAQELGRIAARELIERMALDVNLIDEVIFGCVGQPADAANIARVIACWLEFPKQHPPSPCIAIVRLVSKLLSKRHQDQGGGRQLLFDRGAES